MPQGAVIEKKDMQHTYRDGDDFVFMDMETYEEGPPVARPNLVSGLSISKKR